MRYVEDANPIMQADAYTISGDCLVSEDAVRGSVYYMANRLSPARAIPEIAKDDRLVMYGMSHFIKQLTDNPISYQDLVLGDEFMGQAHVGGVQMPFDRRKWSRILREYNGYLPIAIEALPDGSIYYPHQPMVQVTSLDEDFGEVAAHVESTLVGMVGCTSARATVAAHWRNHILNQIKFYCPGETLDFDSMANAMIQDFGARASSTPLEAKMFGMAHLLFFNGTDTFSAAYAAWLTGERTAGKSILALAHRVVQSYDNEQDCYKNLFKQGVVGSYVGDCYDYKRAVVRDLIPLAISDPNKIIVARPDSGNAIENALFLCQEAVKAGLSKNGPNGIEPTNLLFIEGNSVNPVEVDKIWAALKTAGFNPVKWGIFGVGGWLRNISTRDLFSTGYKLNGIRSKGTYYTPVMKFSETTEKESFPGPIGVDCEGYIPRCYMRSGVDFLRLQNFATELTPDSKGLFTYYNGKDGNHIPKWLHDFPMARLRARHQFKYAPPSVTKNTMGAGLQDNIKRLRKKYK